MGMRPSTIIAVGIKGNVEDGLLDGLGLEEFVVCEGTVGYGVEIFRTDWDDSPQSIDLVELRQKEKQEIIHLKTMLPGYDIETFTVTDYS